MTDQFTIAAEVSYRQVGKEAFVLHRHDSRVYNLNSTAAFIWAEISKEKSVGEIVDDLCRKFSIDRASAYDDTVTLIEKFINNRLVIPIDSNDR